MYVITRGFQEGKQLSTAQKTSARFAEEPVVLGRVLRRGSKPMRLADVDYKANERQLLELEKAGAIKIDRPKEEAMAAPVPCSKCGQVPRGQGGEYKCPVCGLPMVHDPGAGDAPATQGEVVAPEVVAAPPAPPEVIIPPHPPSEPPAPTPPAEEPPPPAPEPTPVVEEKKEEEIPAPPPSAPKAESKSSSKKKGASK